MNSTGFLISNFRRVLNLVCILLGISPGVRLWFADVSEPSISSIFKGWMDTSHLALEDGTDRGFRNVGKPQSDAGEMPKRIHTRLKTRRKFEIKKPVEFIASCIVPSLEALL